MCGIAGFTHAGERFDPAWIVAMRDSIGHRGPDQHGVLETADVSLAAVRLKIIDLVGGDQPLTSDDGDLTVVYNGEIYNHRDLRAELEQLGAVFHTRCDTEVVLQAFRHWDTGCFARLRGMFAVALWCKSERRLVLARDRMGIKPLYIAQGSRLLFGSETKALFAHPWVSRSIDPSGLALYLSLNYIPGPRTMVAGIEKLAPGTWLEWRDGRVRRESYWNLRLDPSRINRQDAIAALDGLLRDAVREQLVSDVPLGVWASGGLDSSTILHYAAEMMPKISTFSISFAGRSFDESRWFREVSERYGCEHQELDLNPAAELTGAIEQLPYYSDEPSADAGALPVWFLSRLTRRQVTVALSGEGADEVFGGYQTYLADRYAARLRLLPVRVRHALLRAANRLPVSNEKIGFEYKLKRLLAGSLLPPVQAHLFWNGTFAWGDHPTLSRQSEAFIDLPQGAGASGELNRYLWLDQLNYLPDDILNKSDRMSMAHSLEVRPPFLDHRLVEFAARLPEDLKIRGSRLKYLLRETMRGKLPASVIRRSKQGFDIPAHHWFRTVLRPMLLDVVTPGAARATGLLDTSLIQQLINDHLERRINAGYHLWGLLILFLWIKRWNIQPPVQHPLEEAASRV